MARPQTFDPLLQPVPGQIGDVRAKACAELTFSVASPLHELTSVWRNERRSRSRRGRSLIGNEVAQRRICFMADSCDNRNFAERYGPHDRFKVERPKIFQRTSATGEQYHIRSRTAAGIPPVS